MSATEQAKSVAERIATAEARVKELEQRYAFAENQRLCLGDAGGCDGDLTATEHDEGCPALEKDKLLRPHLYDEQARALLPPEGR